jgi:hypothetical protein
MFNLLGTALSSPLGNGCGSLTAHDPEARNGGRYPASSEQGTINALLEGASEPFEWVVGYPETIHFSPCRTNAAHTQDNLRVVGILRTKHLNQR